MLKTLLPIVFVAASIVALALCINRWRQQEPSTMVKALQTLGIGCVIAGALALLLF